MPKFHLAMYFEQESGQVPDDLPTIMAEVEALNEALHEAGAWVTAAGFEPAPRARVVTATSEGCETTDGPYLPTKEHSGGFWLIEAKSMGDALVWASRASTAIRLPIEVRQITD